MKYEEIWQKARSTEMEVSPYLKTRVLAYTSGAPKIRRQLWFWRVTSAVSFALLLFVLSFRMENQAPRNEVAALNQNYVFHVNFSETDLDQVQTAEIELPDGVKFVSHAHPNIAALQILRLPIQISQTGTNKLPFVIKAVKPGHHQVAIRLYDEDNKLLREKRFTVNFTNLAQSEVF